MEQRTNTHRDWLTAVLVFLLMQVVAARLVTTDWADNLYFAETLAAFGVILGATIGASRFARRSATWLALGYTVALVPWQISSASKAKLLLDRLEEVGGTLLVSAGQFAARQPVKAPLFFVAIVCLVFWALSVAAGYWAVRHRNVLVGIIPSGIIILVIQIYANYQLHGSWWLGVYLLIALLLVGRVYYLQSERVWAERRVYVNDEAWPNILGGLFTVAAVAILVAWVFPTSISSVQSATDTWTGITRGIRDRLSNAVTSLNGPYGKPGINFYGDALGLGQNAAQGDSPVFTVDVLKTPASYARYYWRGRVYDTYRNGQWSTTPGTSLDFNPESGNLKIADGNDRSEGDFRFTLQFPAQTLIYSPSEPVWLDRTATVNVTPVESNLTDVLSWHAKASIPNGNRYEVHADIANPNVEQLRGAQAVYPEWVRQRYLEVPENIRPRFEALAQKITAGATTPYDKAVAITSYLRANLQYSTSLPAVPEGRDPVDWVLFSYKKGFCNYYASAEVLMLRTVGVPARMAVGFAQGEYAAGVFTVRRRDAHAWPEVFFPGYGWVEFEPTVSQLPLARSDPNAVANSGPAVRSPQKRLEEDAPPEPTGAGAKPKPTAAAPLTNSATGRALIMLYALFIAGWAVYLLVRFRSLRFISPIVVRAWDNSGLRLPSWTDTWARWFRLEPVEQAFTSVSWSLRWLGQPAAVDATPAERSALLRKILPSAAEHIGVVASELERGLFSPEPPDVPRARRAGLLVVLHAVRARVQNFLGVGGAGDVYSR